MKEKLDYPFTAIVGQNEMKQALILNIINPKLGGVLIKGEKGTAKSTTVRALAEVMSEMKSIKNCRYNCDPEDINNLCDECKEKLESENLNISSTNMKVVNLPVSATEDRVIGSIDIEKAIKTGSKSFEPGILAESNRNILYVDEVNLLDDHIVDVLLDSAAMGVNIVEREGISVKHPAKFVLVGTMNPEEGELRPQLLDRFALCVNIEGIKDIQQRIEIMERRLKFEENPKEFIKLYNCEQDELKNRIIKAKEILPKVEISKENLETIANLSVGFGVDGHRADIFMLKTAKTIAAFNLRTEISSEDINQAATLVINHRLRKTPFEDEQINKENMKETIDNIKDDIEKKRRK